MKKTKFLALTLAVTLMLMGAGYAFWTEAFNINAVVDTGELNFAFVDVDFEAGPNTDDAYNGKYVGGSAGTSDDDHTLDLTFSNLYPGATATVNFCIENTGTIGLKLEDLEFIGDDDNLAAMRVSEDGGEKMGIEEYFETLEGIAIDVDGKICKELVFSVNKCATEEKFAELANFGFSVSATVKQFNDDGSCPEPEEPEPEITGLRFELTKNCKKYFFGQYKYSLVSGTFYYTMSEGPDIEAGKISGVKINKNSSKSYTYGGFPITLTNDSHGNITW